MIQQRFHSGATLIHLTLMWLTLTIHSAHAEPTQAQQLAIEKHAVNFDPAIQITPDEKGCVGLIYSADKLIMPSDCATAAKKIMRGRPIHVLNQDGAVIGKMKTIEINSPQQLLENLPISNRVLPFIPVGTDDETPQKYPRIFQASRSHNSTPSAPLYLWMDNQNNSRSSHWLEFQSVRQTKPGYYIFPLQDEESLYTRGSPVIDGSGRVVCLMTEAGHCQGLVSTIGDDASCQMNCLKCVNYSWDSCSNGTGLGTCKNTDSGETCDVAVFREGDQFNSATCTGEAGCAAVTCPSDCYDDNSCDCVAGYGFDNDDLNIVDPDGCIDDLDNAGCDDLGGAGWALIGGMAVLGVTAVVITSAIVCGIIYCKYRGRSGYKTIQSAK